MNCCCGSHVQVKKTIVETIDSIGSKSKCFQCFISGSTNYTLRYIPADDAMKAGEILDKRKITMYTHSPYVINLAREGDESIVNRSKACLQNMVDALYKINPSRTGTVVHIGAKGTIENVCKELNDLDLKVPVLMENCAETSKLGRTLNELRKIIEGTDSQKVGICVDTCHAHCGNLCDLSDPSQTEKFFEDLSFMANRKLIFHVNDSLTNYGSRLDRHAPVGYGTIWNLNRQDSLANLERFYELIKMEGSDVIFETPNEFSSKYEQDLFLSV